MSDAVADVQQRINEFFPGTIGIRITEALPDRVVAAIDVTRGLCTVPGVMHGGAVMASASRSNVRARGPAESSHPHRRRRAAPSRGRDL